MKTLKVIICKAGKGISAHIREVEGFIMASDSVEKLKKDLAGSVKFHIEGLYEEERKKWMNEDYKFKYLFEDIPALIDGYSGLINQSSLARISGINESLMRQYVTGIKKPSRQVIQRIEHGLSKYAEELRGISFIND